MFMRLRLFLFTLSQLVLTGISNIYFKIVAPKQAFYAIFATFAQFYYKYMNK